VVQVPRPVSTETLSWQVSHSVEGPVQPESCLSLNPQDPTDRHCPYLAIPDVTEQFDVLDMGPHQTHRRASALAEVPAMTRP